MLDKIRALIQLSILKLKLKRIDRERKTSSFDTAKSVGIVCLVDKEENWNEIKKVIKEFQDKGIKIEVMGVFYGNLKPLWFIETLNVTLCSDKELGISQIPTGMHVDEFLEKSFDILIDFSIIDKFATFYLMALSKAKFKIGLDTIKNRKHFDMVLKIEELNMREYCKQLLHYLQQITTR